MDFDFLPVEQLPMCANYVKLYKDTQDKSTIQVQKDICSSTSSARKSNSYFYLSVPGAQIDRALILFRNCNKTLEITWNLISLKLLDPDRDKRI